MPKGEAVGDDFDAPLIGDRNVQVHVREPDVACHSGVSFTAYPRDGVLEGQRAGGQNTRGSTGRAVVTERVQYPVAAASARCEREGQAQVQEVQGAGSEGPCLGQQQRTGRRGEVRKMRLVRALIACTGSRTLPAPERRHLGLVQGARRHRSK